MKPIFHASMFGLVLALVACSGESEPDSSGDEVPPAQHERHPSLDESAEPTALVDLLIQAAGADGDPARAEALALRLVEASLRALPEPARERDPELRRAAVSWLEAYARREGKPTLARLLDEPKASPHERLQLAPRADDVPATAPLKPFGAAAARAGRVDELFRSVAREEDVSAPDRAGRTPLHHAAADGDDRAVALLLHWYVNRHAVDADGLTPLHLAVARADNGSVIELLVGSGADPDALDAKGRTPLHHAAMNGRQDACLALLRAGASAALKDGQGRQPAELAAEHDDLQRVLSRAAAEPIR